jgi:hypothetical protein
MPKFAIIAEGPTDVVVLENILQGYFEDESDEVVVNPVQPPRPLTQSHAGWGLVFKSLKRRDYEGAFQFNDYLIIHIDTDVQEEAGFDVPRREGGEELSLPERVDRVIARLKSDIDEVFLQTHGQRIFFAIAVDSIECWLLPLLHDDKKKAAKTAGCLKSANEILRKRNQKGLSAGEKKFTDAYEDASSAFRRRKTLMQAQGKNPSFELFVRQLANIPPVPVER